METQHKNIINSCLEKLIRKTDYFILQKACVKYGMLSLEMADIIERAARDEPTKHKKLFEKITKRGPKAFAQLLDICQQLFPEAYDELCPSTRYKEQMHSTHQRVAGGMRNPVTAATTNHPGGDATLDGKCCSKHLVADKNNTLEVHREVKHKFQVKKSSGPSTNNTNVPPVYPMKSRIKGVALIINMIHFERGEHSKRNGAEVDGENLVSLFQQLDFTVFYYEDVTKSELLNLIEKLKRSTYLPCECFVFYILSHGRREHGIDKVYLHDNQTISVEDILTKFNSPNCEELIGKPKLFFISMCRGDIVDSGYWPQKIEQDGRPVSGTQVPRNVATFRDMLICYATVPGYAALRDPANGSWLVQSMCKVWAEHAHVLEVEHLMKLVGIDASTYRSEESALQTISREDRGFNYCLFFNPGYYE